MRSFIYNNLFFRWQTLLFLFLFMACNSDDDDFPRVKFRYEMLLTNEMQISGNSTYNELYGVGGVIVVCVQYDVMAPANSIYYAYDAACTHEISDSCSVEVRNNSIYAVCPCCGSEFSLYGGVPLSGDAVRSLQEYNVSLLGNRLVVYN